MSFSATCWRRFIFAGPRKNQFCSSGQCPDHYAGIAAAALGVNALLKLRNEIQTLSYFPSCLLLGVLTDVGRDVYTSQYHTSWGWLLPLLLVLYAGLAFLLRRFWPVRTGGEGEMFGTLNWNVFFCWFSVE